MKLQKKVLLAFSILFISVLVLISIFFSTILLASYTTLEEQHIEKDLDQAVKKLNEEFSTLSAIVSDWGPWDDTYNFVNGNDPEYAKSNLMVTAFNNLKINLFIIINNKGEVVYSGAYDLQNKVIIPVPALFQRPLDHTHPLMNMSDPHYITARILMLPDYPMIIASHPIVRSDFSGQPQGVVIMGRYLDKAEISRLAALTQPRLAFTRIDDPTLSRDFVSNIRENSGSSPGIIQQLNGDEIAGYALIPDIYGNDAFVLQITEDRDIYRQGLYTTVQVLLIIIVSSLFLGLVVIILLNRFLLKRMDSLAVQVYTIGKSGRTIDHVEIEGDDELSVLATEINRMLVTIEQTQQKVQVSEARFRGLAENLPLTIFEMDIYGKLLYANKTGNKTFGVTEEKIAQGINVRDFLSPDNIEIMERGLALVLSGGQAPGNIYPLTRADGSQIQAIVSTSLMYQEGHVIGFRGVIFDISDRLKLEKELKESEEKYHTIADFTYSWEFWIGPDGNYIYVSPSCERITGYLPEEFVVDQNLMITIVHPDDRDRVLHHLSHIESIFKEKDAFEFRIITRSGKERWISHEYQPVHGRNGEFLGLRGSNRDITRHKQAEEALHESNQKLRLLTGITRHDILNKLSAAKILQDLALHTSDPGKVKEYISQAQEAGDLIEETIGFTREYENFGIVSSGWQQIYNLIDSAKTELSLDGVTVINQIPEDLEVYADPIIRKVFTTLMENAIRHGGDITFIRFFCSKFVDTLSITCEDDGVGVQPEEKSLIFDHGYGKHTGIGLFLVREILSITGLSIQECGEPGKGAGFEILVPAGKFRIHREDEK